MTIEKIYTKEDVERIIEEVLAVEREARKEQAREIERLTSALDSDKLRKMVAEARSELAALKAQPSGVVLPERKPILWSAGCGHETPNHAWNACLDEVARLNACQVSAGEPCQAENGQCPGDGVSACKKCPEKAGGVGELAAFEAVYAKSQGLTEKSYSLWFERHGDTYTSAAVASAWFGWQARAALTASAPNHGEQVPHDLAMAMHQRDHYANRVFVLELGIGKIASDFIPSSDDEAPIALGEMRDALEALLAAAPSAQQQGGDV